ncbi:MAG: hypothetical protein M9928_14830 [Anaerolineae bacterium]|nr:hypothetical protein [Anaerolineae bacterium]MCO5197192.1 hypothetical protein [Anaerolineae bacterium]MCO5206307.1 hypothetical protein [Anaerolineae bacterium]
MTSLDTLALINDVLQATIVIFGSSVILYNTKYFIRDEVTRAFSLLLAFVVTVYFTELLVSRTTVSISAEPWLAVEWLGICFVPAAQLHLSNALLVSTGKFSRRRRVAVWLGYGFSSLFFILVLFTDWIVGPIVTTSRAPHFAAGPLFFVFVIFFIILSAGSIYNIWRAYRRTITSTTRQRMRNIFLASLAAPLGVFPYLTLTGSSTEQVTVLMWLLLIVGNVLVALMFATLTANLVYFGALSSDRVVRVRLYKFMARVPLTGTIVLLVYVLVDRAGPILGIPSQTALAIAVVGTVMIVEWAIHAFKLPLERVLQLNNEPDVRRIQQLSERLLTSHDLHQYLESLLAAGCDVFQVPTAFIASFSADGPRLEAIIGQPEYFAQLWRDDDWQTLVTPDKLDTAGGLIIWRNYWIEPLYDRQNNQLLGIMGIESRSPQPDLNVKERLVLANLSTQAATALKDRLLQQVVFTAVEGLLPEITAFQIRRSAAGMRGRPTLTPSAEKPVQSELLQDDEFNKMVKDALTHYWGGPKLTESPLLELEVVQDEAQEHDGNPAKALRAVLQRAIEYQKPEGDRSMTRTEWVLYNILELKFVQGSKVRDVARRLAMSESDLYRKQRIAIENVADAVYEMELERLQGMESAETATNRNPILMNAGDVQNSEA